MKILSESEIIEKATTDLSPICGVYFLIYENEIVYIGQSVNCKSRIKQHLRDVSKQFDSWYWNHI